ncbi:MAG: hypothetical protein AAF297_11920 [Planctomycetota bacterium]
MKNVISVAAILSLAGTAAAQVSATAILLEGDVIDGATVTALTGPRVNASGQVGSLATLSDDSRAMTIDGASIFNSGSVLSNALTGGESAIGIGNNGEFIYSPSVDGSDAVWGQDGLIAIDDTQAPDFAPGINSTFHSRPVMAGDGTAYWISGFNDGMGGTSSQGRMIYTQDATTGAITTILRAGDLVDGAIVNAFGGIDFDFGVSNNNAHQLVGFTDLVADTTTDAVYALNGVIIAREGSSNGSGLDNWDNFNDVAVNNAGNYVFTGDTDGDSTADNFAAYNSIIGVREGDIVDNFEIDGVFDGIALSNNNEAAYIVDAVDGAGDAEEALFYAADASAMGDAIVLLRVGDVVDLGADGQWILDDFNAFNTGDIALGDNGIVSVEVDLESFDGLTNIEAIISVAVPAPGAAGLLGLAGLAATRRRRG